MKKLILIFTLISNLVYSQEFYELYSDTIINEECAVHDTVHHDTLTIHDLPEFYVIDGDTVGIILTIEQAQKIDNDLEMLALFKQLDKNAQEVDDFYIEVIKDQESRISLLQTTLSKLEKSTNKQDQIIETLKDKLKNKKEELELTNEQRFNDQVIIEGLKQDLSKEKTKKIVGTTTAGGVGAILLGLTLYFGLR